MNSKRLVFLKGATLEGQEREALKETIRQLELDLHLQRAELKKTRREVAALRLLVSIQRVKEDPRITTTTSLDEEMNNYVYNIVRHRHIEVLTYDVAKMAWDSWEGN